jgi:hypothetical protein
LYNNGGCNKCAREEQGNIKKNKASLEFKNKVMKVHNNPYLDFSKVNYIKNDVKVNMICNKNNHGDFWVTPRSLTRGDGCPKCRESKGERYIREILNRKKISYIGQYKFKDCKNTLPLPFDFYIPQYNVCIEFDHKQHYEAVKLFGGKRGFKKRKINDNIKDDYCKLHNISLVRIPYWDINNTEQILEDKLVVTKSI